MEAAKWNSVRKERNFELKFIPQVYWDITGFYPSDMNYLKTKFCRSILIDLHIMK